MTIILNRNRPMQYPYIALGYAVSPTWCFPILWTPGTMRKSMVELSAASAASRTPSG